MYSLEPLQQFCQKHLMKSFRKDDSTVDYIMALFQATAEDW